MTEMPRCDRDGCTHAHDSHVKHAPTRGSRTMEIAIPCSVPGCACPEYLLPPPALVTTPQDATVRRLGQVEDQIAEARTLIAEGAVPGARELDFVRDADAAMYHCVALLRKDETPPIRSLPTDG